MCIVLEGVDRCGKSSIAEMLKRITDWPIIHFTNPDKLNPPVKPFDYFMKEYNREDGNVIFDRSHLSNDVYSKVYKGQYDLSEQEFIMLENALWEINPTIIILEDTMMGIMRRWSDKEMYSTQKLPDLLFEFNQLKTLESRTCFPIHSMNYKYVVENGSLPKHIKIILEEEQRIMF